MKIDRYMVSLFFEIRRSLPLVLQEGMAISNPNLGDEMVKLHQNIDDENIKLLITVFLQRAGEEWHLQVSNKITKRERFARLTGSGKSNSSSVDKKLKPKRIYRGQIVE